MSNFKASLHRFSSALDALTYDDLKKKSSLSIADFSEKKKEYKVSMLNSSFKLLFDSVYELDYLKNPEVNEIKQNLVLLRDHFNKNEFESARQVLAKILLLESKLSYKKEITRSLSFKISNLPKDIGAEVDADLNELEKCFKADCYRASIILCARLLETALHRKYYEITKNDLLEKSPGIGLGNLIAKMKEQNIQLDPAITQQIHLINQVRIYSVHTKKQPFNPTKDQTHAIILYTLDIIRKLFSSPS